MSRVASVDLMGLLQDLDVHGHLADLAVQVVDLAILFVELVVGVGLQGALTTSEEGVLPGQDVAGLEVVLARGLIGRGLTAQDLKNQRGAPGRGPPLDLVGQIVAHDLSPCLWWVPVRGCFDSPENTPERVLDGVVLGPVSHPARRPIK